MAHVLSPNTPVKLQRSETPIAARPSLNRALSFQYYIHDSVPNLRFQLIGDLRAANLTELKGSWNTARTTLDMRRFVLDVRQLYSTDTESRAWLLTMKDAGARFLPTHYLDSSEETSPSARESVEPVKLSLLGMVMGLFRS